VPALLSIDRLAPELKASRSNRVVVALAVTVVLGLAVGGMALGLYLKGSRAGVSQVQYFSTEAFGTAAGARLVYYPEKRTVVVKGWLMLPLRGQGIYQVWAVEGGAYRSIGMADALDYVGFALVAQADLTGVERLVITQEPPGGSRAPTSAPLVEIVRQFG